MSVRQPKPEPAALDRAVQELGEVEHRAGWGRVERIAEVIAKHLFAGEVEHLCKRDGERTTSVRRLASHPGCPLSKSQLHETLSAFVVYREDEFVRSAKHLTPSHVAMVARLPSNERAQLLRRVVEQAMSVRELNEVVRELRRKNGEKRGRPPTSPIEKAITRIENAVLYLEEGTQLMAGTLPTQEEKRLLVELLDKAHDLVRSATRNTLEVRKSGYPESDLDSGVHVLHRRAG